MCLTSTNKVLIVKYLRELLETCQTIRFLKNSCSPHFRDVYIFNLLRNLKYNFTFCHESHELITSLESYYSFLLERKKNL